MQHITEQGIQIHIIKWINFVLLLNQWSKGNEIWLHIHFIIVISMYPKCNIVCNYEETNIKINMKID